MSDPDDPDVGDADPSAGAVVHHTYDWAVTPVVEAIHETVVSVLSSDASGLDPLHTVVDLDELALLVTHEAGSSLAVSFAYAGYLVSVHASGDVYLYDQ